MVPHQYINASDNLAQHQADQINRQEVTVEFIRDNELYDIFYFRWLGDEMYNMGLDPWRMIDYIPNHPETRIFVQRKDLRDRGIYAGNTPAWRRLSEDLVGS